MCPFDESGTGSVQSPGLFASCRASLTSTCNLNERTNGLTGPSFTDRWSHIKGVCGRQRARIRSYVARQAMLKTAFNRDFLNFINILCARFPTDANLDYLSKIVQKVVETDPQSDIFLDPFQRAVKPQLERVRAKDETLITGDEIKPLSALNLPALWVTLPQDEKDALWIYLKKLVEQACLIQTVQPQLGQFEELAGTMAHELKERKIDVRQSIASGNLVPMLGQLIGILTTNTAIQQSLGKITKSFEDNPDMQRDVSQMLGMKAPKDRRASADGVDVDSLNRDLDAESDVGSSSASDEDDSDASGSSGSNSDSDSASSDGESDKSEAEARKPRPKKATPTEEVPALSTTAATAEDSRTASGSARASSSSSRRRRNKAGASGSDGGSMGITKEQLMAACEQLTGSGKLQEVLANMGVPLAGGLRAPAGQSLAGPRGAAVGDAAASSVGAAAPAPAPAAVEVD
jgi:hypothetical protein